MFADLRHALRGLRREPVFTVVAVASIALAIGVNSAIFSVADGLWFRPPGVRDSHQLTWIFSTSRESAFGGFSWPEYTEMTQGTRSLSGVVALGRRGTLLHNPEAPPEPLLCNVVSTNFFEVLGVESHAGRLFGASDDAFLRRQAVVVLGHAFWQRRFGGDPAIVGKVIPLGRKTPLPVLVLGVLPASFRDLRASSDRDLWLPVHTWSRWDRDPQSDARGYRWFEVLGRRSANVPVHQAETELAALAGAWASAHPEDNAGRSIRAMSELEYRLQLGGPAGWALFGVVVLVVLITCVNVANLLLARAARRTKEMAVRAALGAGRGRLLRQLFTESALLGALGSAAGIGLTVWLVAVVPSVLVAPPGLHSPAEFRVDSRVFWFTVVSAFATVVLFGLAPALVATRADIVAAFKADSGRAAASVRRSRAWNGLISAQIAIAVVLLCTTAAVLRSFTELMRTDLGFARKPTVLAWFSAGEIPRQQILAMNERIRGTPGVRDVAFAFRAPLSLSGGGLAQKVYIEGSTTDPRAGLPEIKVNPVSSGYFRVMGIKLLRGRDFTDADQFGGNDVAVVSEQFARQYFGTPDAVGRSISVGGPGQSRTEIVGVVENAVVNSVSEPPQPYFYVPYWKKRYGDLTILIEPELDPESVLASIGRYFRTLDRASQPRSLITLPALVDYNTSRQRLLALFTGILGCLGALLTSVGVYGVTAYGVTHRTQEIGVRMALGASRGDTIRLILWDGLRLLAFGAAAGIPLALAATGALRPVLFGIRPWDAWSLAVALVLLSFCITLASLVPALRATRVNPASALRDSY
jgi:predicted permease